VAKRTQAAKRHRQAIKNRERNYAYRSKLRTIFKKAKLSIETSSEDRTERTAEAMREFDKMVSKGVLHKNNASRHKSRLMHALAKKEVREAPAPVEAPVSETPAA
jgi:small subunit ribosomal protein S20